MLNMLNAVKCDIALNGIIEDGTAIGMGIANGVSRLKDSKAKSKVIILLTDGSNNSGEISPEAAAEIAKEFGIRIYTIGVGTNSETAPFPYGDQVVNVPVEIDEATLRNIAEITNGKYYRATSKESLSEIYSEIDKLERTKLHARQFSAYNEEYQIFALIALLSLLFEIVLRNTVLRKIP
jgi:Ca-activated chloride channel family protein